MADLISRQAAMDLFMTKPPEYYHTSYIVGELNCLPAVDAAPVVHGWWKGYNADCDDWLRNDNTPVFLVCSLCNYIVLNNSSAQWNYCPNCGAKMDGERRDDDALSGR